MRSTLIRFGAAARSLWRRKASTTVWTATAAALLLPRHDSVTVTAYALCSLPAS